MKKLIYVILAVFMVSFFGCGMDSEINESQVSPLTKVELGNKPVWSIIEGQTVNERGSFSLALDLYVSNANKVFFHKDFKNPLWLSLDGEGANTSIIINNAPSIQENKKIEVWLTAQNKRGRRHNYFVLEIINTD